MGMSTFVSAFIPPDEKWRQMKAVWDACTRAAVPVPRDVRSFFNEEEPDERGVRIDHSSLENAGVITEWCNDDASGYELHLDKLSRDVKTVRFYNSW